MKISYQWLQTFFDAPLPPPSELAELITFHSSEIEEIVEVEGDTVIEVKVLPDKSAWLLSHRGVAKEVAAITGVPLSRDPLSLASSPSLEAAPIALSLETPTCDYYAAALITGVTVGPSPEWLAARLRAIGQRPINVVVDVANYVMFEMGQPLHAFDAAKLGRVGDRYAIGVRRATAGETITTLTGDEKALTPEDAVIVDGTSNTPIAIAGVKGGAHAAVDEGTTTLLIEAAHFDRVAIRKTAQRLTLRTDASQRYENGVPAAFAERGLRRVTELLLEIAGGAVVGYTRAGEVSEERMPVSVTLTKINRVLGLTLDAAAVSAIFDRLGYAYEFAGERYTVTPPFERDDLVIAEDLVEEVGRFYGLTKVTAKPLLGEVVAHVNPRHYYADAIRTTLQALGFSEVMTSSFRSHDDVKLKNALASDKGYLRSGLSHNLSEVLAKNVPHRDLLGLRAIKVFEIGTVFSAEAEAFHIGLGVRTGTEYKAKADEPFLVEAMAAVADTLGTELDWTPVLNGVSECSLTAILATLPVPERYEASPSLSTATYQPFSNYPSASRDIALWVPEELPGEVVADALRSQAGPYCVRHTLFDTFSKEGRTSYALRFVFQAPDRTLTSEEVDGFMKNLYDLAKERGWEVR